MSKFLTVAALALLAMTVSAEEKKTLGQKLCTYFSRLPGCGSNETPAEDSDSVQALNCLEYPNSAFCVKARASWSAEEKKVFWARVNQQLDTFEDELESQPMLGGVINCQQFAKDPRCVALRKKWAEEEALGQGTGFVSGVFEEEEQGMMGAINCQAYPDTAFCVKARAQWAREKAAEEEEEQMIRGAVNCQAYPDTPFCVKARAQWAREKAEEEQMIRGAINCQAYPDTPFCVKARAQWAREKAEEKASLFDEEEEQGMMGAINCQAYPDTAFCVKARAQWAREKAEEEQQQQQQLGGAINCQQFPDAPFCVQARAQWAAEQAAEEEQIIGRGPCPPGKFCIAGGSPLVFDESEQMIGGAVNCQAFPDAPFCIKARAKWAAEQEELIKKDQPRRMGLPNCAQFPNAPSCLKYQPRIVLDEEQGMMGAINCVQYANDARCVALRKKWAQEDPSFVSGMW